MERSNIPPRQWYLQPSPSNFNVSLKKGGEITLLRVIPTMTFIHFVTGKSSGILSDISSGILSGISSGILSGISSGILSDKSSGILSGKHSGTLSGISSGILSGKSSGVVSGMPSGILSGISSNILSGISSVILSGISHGILSGISSGILSDILSGISSGILSGRWGPAVHTELGRSQVEVQRCTLSWEGPRLRSSGAHWAGKVPGWGPAVHTELGRSQVEVQQCTLEKLEEEAEEEEAEAEEEDEDLIKSNNPQVGNKKTPVLHSTPTTSHYPPTRTTPSNIAKVFPPLQEYPDESLVDGGGSQPRRSPRRWQPRGAGDVPGAGQGWWTTTGRPWGRMGMVETGDGGWSRNG